MHTWSSVNGVFTRLLYVRLYIHLQAREELWPHFLVATWEIIVTRSLVVLIHFYSTQLFIFLGTKFNSLKKICVSRKFIWKRRIRYIEMKKFWSPIILLLNIWNFRCICHESDGRHENFLSLLASPDHNTILINYMSIQYWNIKLNGFSILFTIIFHVGTINMAHWVPLSFAWSSFAWPSFACLPSLFTWHRNMCLTRLLCTTLYIFSSCSRKLLVWRT